MRPLRVRLIPSGAILAERGRLAESLPERMIGLLNRRSLESDEALVIPRCNAIHTIGMRFAIDVLYLNREGKIVAIYEALPPGRICAAVRHATSVVEFPAGAAARFGLAVGQSVGLEYSHDG